MFIPIEIQEIVIDILGDGYDPSSLRACSLVCRAWLYHSQNNLYRSIALHPGRTLDNILDMFQERPFIRSFVEWISVSLRRGDESTPTLFETIPIRLITELPNLRAFTFRDESGGATPHYISFRPLALACFKQYSSVETLHIGPLVFPTCSDLVRLVAAFPSLCHLYLVHVEFREHTTAQVGLDMAVRWSGRRILLTCLDMREFPTAHNVLINIARLTLLELTFSLHDLALSGTVLPHLPRLRSLKIIADRLHMEAGLHVRDIFKDIHAPDLRHITLELPIDIPQTAAQFCRQLFEQNTRDAFSVLDRAIIELVDPRLFVVTVDIQDLHRPRECLLQTSVAGIFPSLARMSLTSGATRDVPDTESPIVLPTTHSEASEERAPPRAIGAEISFHLLLGDNHASPLGSSSSDIFGTHLASDYRDTTFAVRYRPIPSLPLHHGHDLDVTVLTVSPNSALCASGSRDGTIILWNIPDGTLAQEWLGTGHASGCLAFSPDSLRLASGSRSGYYGTGGSVAVWEVESGARLIELLWREDSDPLNRFERRAIFTCAWSPDGATIMAGILHHSIHIWDAKTYKLLRTILDRRLTFARYSPDGRFLVLGRRDGGFDLYDAGLIQAEPLPVSGPPVFNNDGVISTNRGWITGGRSIMEVLFDPTRKWMAAVYDIGVVVVWDVAHAQAEVEEYMAAKDVRCAAVSADGELRCVIGSGHVMLWSPTDGERWSQSDSRDDPLPTITSTCISSDGDLVALAFADGPDIELRSVSGGCRIQMFRGCHSAGTQINQLIFSPDASVLCSGAEDGTLVFIRVYK